MYFKIHFDLHSEFKNEFNLHFHLQFTVFNVRLAMAGIRHRSPVELYDFLLL